MIESSVCYLLAQFLFSQSDLRRLNSLGFESNFYQSYLQVSFLFFPTFRN